jgi:DNA (cytosine-5)-methyltransferase 1
MDIFSEARLRRTDAVRVTDLFAGAGGFSLGFEAAGATIQAAIEIDAWACETLERNHASRVIHSDIARLSDQEIKETGSGSDIVIGGPPCQGFSIANRKAGDPNDPRNTLFQHFVRSVDLIKPKAFLMENVPGLLKRRASCKRPVIDIIVDELEKLGYTVRFQVLEAMAFGVPQIRPRLFVYGIRGNADPTFPKPTHGPSTRRADLFADGPDLLDYVSLWDAIGDLPELEACQGAEEMLSSIRPANDYQELLRAGTSAVYNHKAMRHSARLVERFSHVKWGESGMHAPEEHAARQRGDYSVLSGKSYSQNNRRMFPDRPCHTIPASFYANFIHPYKNRNFTPREGARIQSFPDWYRFCGKPTVVSTRLLSREGRTEELHLCQYNQIGNAVPPLLSYNLARHIISQI